jgi:hypothetical protein
VTTLTKLVRDMRTVQQRTYGLFFASNMGGRVHAFIEFNGLISKYVDICERAAERGIDFTMANVHGATPLPVELHDLEYLAEKLRCIFGPMLNANPAATEAFKRKLFP